jgi:hypothetical protein
MCGNPTPYDKVQPTVTSGNSYVIPANGTITQWSTQVSNAPAMQAVSLKVFRRVTTTTFTTISRQPFQPLISGNLNSFPVNIPVTAGDLLGINDGAADGACVFTVAAPNTQYEAASDLQVGQTGPFAIPGGSLRINITAVVQPTSAFALGGKSLNKGKGIAKLTVNVPNPGVLAASGNGVGSVEKTASAAGPVVIKIKAKGRKRAALDTSGKVKLRPTITFTPTGGDASEQSLKVKLKQN